VARRVTAIEEARKRQPATLLLDAGNSLMNDQDPAVKTQGASSIQVLNRLGYDAVGLGGRDLMLGAEVLKQRIAEAQVAVLSANVVVQATGQRLAQPYRIVDVQGHRVGIIGLSATATVPGPGLDVRDPLASLREILPEVKGKSDAVIVLSTAPLAIAQEIAKTMPEVALIVSAGEDWPSLPEQGGAGTVIVHAEQPTVGHAGRIVGIARLALGSDGRLAGHAWKGLSLGPEVVDDPDTAAWVATL
jgi:2',3'-cyclic-nucleotide 2'-phosphodiesterase (5'-nucleotidase family)